MCSLIFFLDVFDAFLAANDQGQDQRCSVPNESGYYELGTSGEEDDVEDNQNTNYWDDLVQDNALEAIVFGVLFDVTKADESICGGSADSHDDEPVVDTIEQWAAEYFRTTIGIAAVHGSAEGND